MPVVVWWFRLMMLIVFSEALWAHATNTRRLVATLRQIGLEFADLLARGLLLADAAVVVLLVVSPSLGGLAGIAYVAVVSGVLAAVRLSGREVSDCGCGLRPKPLDHRLFVQNACLIGAGVVVVTAPTAAHADLVAASLATSGLLLMKSLAVVVRRRAVIQA